MHTRRSTMLMTCLLALASCDKKPADKAPDPIGASGSAPAPVVKTSDGTVSVVVNDKIVGTLSGKDLAAWPRLDTLVPVDARRIGSWATVTVKKSAGDKPTELQKPGDHYRDQVIALYAEDGKAAFGVFDPVELAKHGKPTLREVGVTEIRIVADTSGGRGQNEQGSGGGTDPTQLKIAIKAPSGASTFTGEQLLKLPRVDEPGKEDTKGWKLSAILAAAGVTTFSKVTLTDEGGTSLPIEKKDFDDVTTIPFIKLNKSGQLRVRVYKKQGDGWQTTGDLRGLASIDVK